MAVFVKIIKGCMNVNLNHRDAEAQRFFLQLMFGCKFWGAGEGFRYIFRNKLTTDNTEVAEGVL